MATPSTHIKPDPEMTYIKSENGAPVPGLKYEHPHDDDELYEDAGDLDVSSGGRDVWLVKLPAFLAERWRDIDDDEEITLGVVKIPPADQDMVRLSLPPNPWLLGVGGE